MEWDDFEKNMRSLADAFGASMPHTKRLEWYFTATKSIRVVDFEKLIVRAVESFDRFPTINQLKILADGMNFIPENSIMGNAGYCELCKNEGWVRIRQVFRLKDEDGKPTSRTDWSEPRVNFCPNCDMGEEIKRIHSLPDWKQSDKIENGYENWMNYGDLERTKMRQDKRESIQLPLPLPELVKGIGRMPEERKERVTVGLEDIPF